MPLSPKGAMHWAIDNMHFFLMTIEKMTNDIMKQPISKKDCLLFDSLFPSNETIKNLSLRF